MERAYWYSSGVGLSFLHISLTSFPDISYPALALVTIIAQPAAALGSGALAAVGAISLFAAFCVMFVTDLFMDCVWYSLGAWHGEKVMGAIQRLMHVHEADVARIHDYFHTRPALIIISAKLLGGFGIMPVILFTAGAARMSFWRYLSLNALGEVIWTGTLMGLAYYSSSAVARIEGAIGKTTLVLFFACALIAAGFILRKVWRALLQ